MAQATQSYQPQIDWQAVRVLAKLAALRAVKRQIQKEGRVKVTLIPRGMLDALAKEYLTSHPELFQEALASPQTAEARKSRTSRVQISCTKWRATVMIVGYARVSTDGQTLDSQLAALRQAGAERVFSEKVSGAVTDRKALGRAIEALGYGDVL